MYKQRIIISVLLAISLSLTFKPIHAEELKIGLVNLGVILKQIPMWRESQTKIKKKFEPRQRKLKTMETELTSLNNKYLKNEKIMWQFGDSVAANLIIQDIVNIQNKKTQKFNTAAQVFLYTSESNAKDVKFFHQMKIENLTLLNPLSVLKTAEDEQFHEYNTLPLAETGNAFEGIDV